MTSLTTSQTYYQKNKERIKARVATNRQKNPLLVVNYNHKRDKALEDIRIFMLSYLGGSCIKCGYNKCSSALDFHHRNPESKRLVGIRNRYKILNASEADIRQELDTCDLLCANCHREIHHEMNHKERLAEISG